MDASKKQRVPVAFKSLAELKRFIRPGVEFKTVSHANHADMVGLTRVVTTVQTVGFYSKILTNDSIGSRYLFTRNEQMPDILLHCHLLPQKAKDSAADGQ